MQKETIRYCVQKLYEIISNIYNDYLNYSATSLQVYVDYNEDDKADSLIY